MAAEYFVDVLQTDQEARVRILDECIARELKRLGAHRSVQVVVTPDPAARCPTVGVYFASRASADDAWLQDRLAERLERGELVVPVVDQGVSVDSIIPRSLLPLRRHAWVDDRSGEVLARAVLEELGIEDRCRRVFISHKRDDGLLAAEQLHDFLSHHGFEPFVDRFGIGLGGDIQQTIADALEHHTFLLLVETPLAHTSDSVYDEVDYALSHTMGICIVTWPGQFPKVPATEGLSRHNLKPRHLREHKGYKVLTDQALEELLYQVEAIHANTLARRRRNLVRNVEEAARKAGLACTPLEQWRLLVDSPGIRTVVQVSARLPTVDDLHSLDTAITLRGGNAHGVLVHAARGLPEPRKKLLSWAAGTRPLTLVPENSIGAWWSP